MASPCISIMPDGTVSIFQPKKALSKKTTVKQDENGKWVIVVQA